MSREFNFSELNFWVFKPRLTSTNYLFQFEIDPVVEYLLLNLQLCGIWGTSDMNITNTINMSQSEYIFHL